ncbi:MAG: hypothetical protein ACOVP1_12300 [Bacteroidia bacterium]
MKYLIIYIVGLGLSLSMMFGFIYTCEGSEVMPSYYASPFVFKKTSLASSMEFFYSLSGVFYNSIVWTLTLILIDRLMLRLIHLMKEAEIFERIYFVLKLGPFLLAVFFILLSLLEMGVGFDTNSNYWSIDLQQEAKTWGVLCNQKWVLFFEEL